MKIFNRSILHLEEFLWGLSIIYLALCFLTQRLRKAIVMTPLSFDDPSFPLPSFPSPPSWVIRQCLPEQRGDHQGPSLSEDSAASTVLAFEQSTIVCEENKEGHSEGIQRSVYQQGRKDKRLPVKIASINEGGEKGRIKLMKKRPGRLVMPEYCPELEFKAADRTLENKEPVEVQGRGFFLVCKKGRREVMEDGYGVILDILGDTKQAFFAVIDGHGGRAAADYVAENLGKNIIEALENVNGNGRADNQLEQAIRGGYLVTDREFLSQGVGSGACAASVLLKDGELHVANVGDCKVVISRKGVAHALTIDHRLNREDERLRIENSGGFVHCRNGIWRVQGSLAISRAIGDLHMKQWIISEPDITMISLTSDCDFLIMASDGLWDKVHEQEAVDVVLKEGKSVESCKTLVDMSICRGNLDDITVMVINLQTFMDG